jgi:CheY-like chemotaxis protein
MTNCCNTQSLKFFVVEDNPQDLYLIQKAVLESFPTAHIAKSHRLSICIESVKKDPVDIIIVDLNLPDSKGYETFETLKQHFPDIPLFILSVYGDKDLVSQAISDGAADYFSKDYLTEPQLLGQSLHNAIERHCILEKLKASEQRFRGVLDSSSDGIVVTDLNGNILFQNTATKLLLSSLNISQGSKFPLTPDAEKEQIITLSHIPGRSAPLTVSVKTTFSHWNDKPAYCLTLRDFTDRQVMMDAVVVAQKLADLSNQAKSAFLANMSHEIRTPLNGIMGAATLLLDTQLTREQSDYVNTISHSSDFLLTLINDLLDFSKIEAGKIAVEQIPFNLKEIIQTCLDQFNEAMRGPDVEFIQNISSELPKIVIGDPWRLRQILTNLLSNAFKFTQKGSVTLSVMGHSQSGSLASLEFTVKDTGIGISEQLIPNLFSPFMQGDMSITKRYGGTGLGLAISKRLTQLMNGDLTVRSSFGRGSSFCLTLPLKVEKEERDSTELLSISSQANSETDAASPEVTSQAKLVWNNLKDGHNNTTNPLILAAEDHPINQKLVVKMLEKLGCRVLVANSGPEAIDRAAHTALDLILMDCQMPGMDGIQVTQALRKLPQYASTPIIAMTAFVYPSDVNRCLSVGMNDVLKKPFKKKELEEMLCKWLPVNLSTLSPSSQFPLLDEEMVRGWKEIAGEDSNLFQKEFLELFFSTSREIIEQVKEAIAQNDKESLKRLLHRFKGSAGHLGASRLANYIESSELYLAGQNEIPAEIISQLQSEVGQLRKALSGPQFPGTQTH